MKRTCRLLLASTLLSLSCPPLFSRSLSAPAISGVCVERAQTKLIVSMNVNVASSELRSEECLTVTPVVTDGTHRVALPSLVIAGRSRYYRLLRSRGSLPAGCSVTRYSSDLLPAAYSAVAVWEPWMEISRLTVEQTSSGCCGSADIAATAIEAAVLDYAPRVYVPEYLFVTPAADAVKTRRMNGSAFIDFKVNQTEILPDYRRNPSELAAIRRTVGSVSDNPDVSITRVSVVGYASPDGPYANNERLAEGRTRSVASYVESLCSLPRGVMHTSWVAEDWAGLGAFLSGHPDFPDRDALLGIVNGDRDPDTKEWLIKSRYPSAYGRLLEEVYPSLRHSDYTIDYTVRSYSTAEEIAAVYSSNPGNLSLQELYVLAGSLPEGSADYNGVFETALSLYPESSEAWLNAAVAAMKRDDLPAAERYLERAGRSAASDYSRGVLCARRGDYVSARPLFVRAAEGGIEEARRALSQLDAIERR